MNERTDGQKIASSASGHRSEVPSKTQPRWDVYLQEDGTAAVCLGGTRTYYEAKLAADSHNA